MSDIVLPAHAGMIPDRLERGGHAGSAPRTCGDDPSFSITIDFDNECSPHMRG